ncbi:MAG: uracil-DNA glycosylase [Zetaproteobacteria bacterium]|nr:MAG: uracil-DNA glycosylase [Zetaproteobacteria bacterium]
MRPEAQRLYLTLIGVDPVRIEALAAPQAQTQAPKPSPASSPDPVGAMQRLAEEARTCRRCALAETRTQVVFGVGDPRAKLVIIGEAPGRDEDLQGEPFVGRAGKLLDKILAAVGLSRAQVYIMNILKCRPPNNRDPRPEEIEACAHWRERQLEILRPKVIMLLGRVAAQTMLGTKAPTGSLRGRVHEVRGVPAIVSWHPAYLLRQPSQKRSAWEDWQKAIALLREDR